MTKTPIEWTDFSLNPLRFRNRETGKVGHHCTKISPGCKFCYASKLNGGPYLSGLTFIEENRDKGDFFLDEAVLAKLVKRQKAAKVFWCDMTDLFLEDYPFHWIDRCFAAMALTPNLIHQVLTKRSKRMLEWASQKYLAGDVQVQVRDLRETYRLPFPLKQRLVAAEEQVPEDSLGMSDVDVWPLPNVWMGVSVEDKERRYRIDHLRQTPAAVRFLSCEPLLEDLGKLDLRGISWAIIGGESGTQARPCDLAWVRSIIGQCRAAGTAPFVKQVGADPREGSANGNCRNPDCTHPDCGYIQVTLSDPKGGLISEWAQDLQVREMPR
jgi:protein gp37